MLSQSLLNDFDADVAIGHGLPGKAYTSNQFLRAERQLVFSSNWILMGYRHPLDATDVADYVPVVTLEFPSCPGCDTKFTWGSLHSCLCRLPGRG